FQVLPGQSENATLDYQRNVTVIDTRSNAVVSLLAVQRGPWGIAYDPANQRIYVADAFTNNLSVLPPIYNLTFQVGSWLPPPATWSLTLANLTLWSNSSSVRFAEPNGTYAYALQVVGHPSLNTTGLVTVNGADISILLIQPGGATYPVTFSEVGLPPGRAWSVTLAGSAQSPTTGSIAFTEPNGTY
ncbi:thermopsin precursor, partial [mine drainage metagenome]